MAQAPGESLYTSRNHGAARNRRATPPRRAGVCSGGGPLVKGTAEGAKKHAGRGIMQTAFLQAGMQRTLQKNKGSMRARADGYCYDYFIAIATYRCPTLVGTSPCSSRAPVSCVALQALACASQQHTSAQHTHSQSRTNSALCHSCYPTRPGVHVVLSMWTVAHCC